MSAGRFTVAIEERGLACEWLLLDMAQAAAVSVIGRFRDADAAWHVAALLSEGYTDGALPHVFDIPLAPTTEPW